jgi:hypothetical protein
MQAASQGLNRWASHFRVLSILHFRRLQREVN